MMVGDSRGRVKGRMVEYILGEPKPEARPKEKIFAERHVIDEGTVKSADVSCLDSLMPGGVDRKAARGTEARQSAMLLTG